MLKYGIEHLVDQVVNPKVNSSFLPKIESVVNDFLGIQEIPPPSAAKLTLDNNKTKQEENKSQKTSNKTETNVETKVEPKEPQPMDIETESESSRDAFSVDNNLIKSNQNSNDSDNQFVDWPTPPQPEMLTPERTQDTNDTVEKLSNKEEEPNLVKKEKEEEPNLTANSTTSETPKTISEQNTNSFSLQVAASATVKKETPVTKLKNTVETEKQEKKVAVPKSEEDSYLSDVSSVHTSDLSDFDDQISLSSEDEQEETKKKKISLKVIKESILNKESILKSEESQSNDSQTEHFPRGKERKMKDSNSEIKRVRKINPKYASGEYSSIFSRKQMLRSRSLREDTDDEADNLLDTKTIKSSESEAQSTSDSKLKVRKRRASNNPEVEQSDAKLSKKSEDPHIENRSSSRASMDSETTQDSSSSQQKTSKKKGSKR